LLVLPSVDAVNDGLNARFAQFATWNGTETAELAPSPPVIVPVIDIGSQLVGLNVKPRRLMFLLTCLICRGMPAMIVGHGSGLSVRCAVYGLI
jgi:hypothetical protein